MYHMPSSSSSASYSCSSDQAIKEGLWSGRSVGGGQGGVDILRGSVVMREEIQREFEEKIREEIMVEEIVRKRVLEAEIRREVMIEREMMKMQIGGGFPPSFMIGPQRSHNTSFVEKSYGSGRHGREIGGFQVDPFQRLPRSPKKEVIDLEKPNGATLSGTKQKTPSSAAVNSKKTEEWSCAVCKFSATCEHNFNEHLAGKKHQAKVAALRGAKIGLGVACEKPTTIPAKLLKNKKSAKTQPPLIKNSRKCVPISLAATGSSELCSNNSKKKTKEWSCAVCEISATCERGLNEHLAGKKHQAKVATLRAPDTELGLGGAPKEPTTMPAKHLESKKPVKTQPSLIKNSSKCVSASPAVPVSSELCSNNSRKKTELWSCAVCEISATCERGLNEHLAGKKHQAKVAAPIDHN